MKRESGFFESFDRTKLFYRSWICEKPDPDACLIIHGYGEHSGRYEELAEFLSDLPCSFFSFDLRGQGRSGGQRVHAKAFEDFVEDTESYVHFLSAAKLVPAHGLSVLGHSLGGLIALNLAPRLGTRLKKIALSSPFLGAYGLASLELTFRLSRALNRVAPNLILPGPVRPQYLFHGKDAMKRYLADSLIERRITARLGYELLRKTRKACARTADFSVPLLVQASGDDRIVSLEKTKRWFEKTRAPRKELKIYSGFYHEIFHEIGREKPIRDLKLFLGNKNGGSA